MSFLNAKRDSKAVYASLKRVGDTVTALKPVSIYIPARYLTRGLATFESDIDFLGIFAIVDGSNNMAVSMINGMVRSEPTLISTRVIDDVEYRKLDYAVGAKVIASTKLRKIDSLLYRIYDEFLAKGRVPGFMSYNNLCDMFYTAGKYSGPRVGANIAVQEMIAATISKNPKNLREPYRMVVKTMDDSDALQPAYIGLRTVGFGSDSAVAKLMGQRFDANMTSSLIAPGAKVGRIERLLRT